MPPFEVWGAFPHLAGHAKEIRDRLPVMVMQLYIDDSGRNDPPVFVLAGYIARATTWAAFCDEWAAALAEAPAIDYFKMKEAFACNGRFAGFTAAQRDFKLARLGRICVERLNAGITVVTRHDEYESIFEGVISPGMDTPYFLLSHMMAIAAVEYQNGVGINEPIDLVFDMQMGESEGVQAHFSKIIARGDKTINSRLMGPPRYMDDKTTLPLQAADMLAWHMRRHHRDIKQGTPGTWTAAYPFIERIPVHIIDFTKERMLWTVATMQAETTAEEKLFPHEAREFRRNLDGMIAMYNLRLIDKSPEGSVIEALSMPDKRMKRFVLVRSCPDVRSPHLHRRAGGDCLGEGEIQLPFGAGQT